MGKEHGFFVNPGVPILKDGSENKEEDSQTTAPRKPEKEAVETG